MAKTASVEQPKVGEKPVEISTEKPAIGSVQLRRSLINEMILAEFESTKLLRRPEEGSTLSEFNRDDFKKKLQEGYKYVSEGGGPWVVDRNEQLVAVPVIFAFFNYEQNEVATYEIRERKDLLGNTVRTKARGHYSLNFFLRYAEDYKIALNDPEYLNEIVKSWVKYVN